MKFQLLVLSKIEKIGIFHFLGLFSLKRLYLKIMYEFFSKPTGRDRKLKFGMDDPYYMLLKTGYPFVDICFGLLIYAGLCANFVKNGKF